MTSHKNRPQKKVIKEAVERSIDKYHTTYQLLSGDPMTLIGQYADIICKETGYNYTNGNKAIQAILTDLLNEVIGEDEFEINLPDDEAGVNNQLRAEQRLKAGITHKEEE